MIQSFDTARAEEARIRPVYALASISSATPFADACFSTCCFYALAMI
jgi:hypothetical protein